MPLHHYNHCRKSKMEFGFSYPAFYADSQYIESYDANLCLKSEHQEANTPSCASGADAGLPVFEYSRRHDSVSSSRTPSPQSCHSGDNNVSAISTKIESLEEIAAAISDDRAAAKPKHSYVALISMAILNAPDRSGRLILGDIYSYVTEHFPYYKADQKAWKNSIRYNLSTNECFMKAGKEEGKGFYWAIHPSCVSDFSKGDYSRRQPKKRMRRANKKLVPSVSHAANPYMVSAVQNPWTPSVAPHPRLTDEPSSLQPSPYQYHPQTMPAMYQPGYWMNAPYQNNYYHTAGYYDAPVLTDYNSPNAIVLPQNEL